VQTRILLVEDDETASELIYHFLKDCGFDVQPVFTASDGVSYLRNEHFDIVLLDINLPDFDGYEVLKSLRRHTAVPVIVTSAYGDTKSKLTAFKFGASDYMVKPLDMEELEARIWVHLQRHCKIESTPKKRGFHKEGETVRFQEKELELTAVERTVFSLLLERKNQVVSREDLLAYANLQSNRALDNHIKNIRKKLVELGGSADMIKTVYGVGYSLKEE